MLGVALTGSKALKSEIEGTGGKCAAYTLDVSDDTALVAIEERIASEVGTITILVNNAGIVDAQYAARMSLDLINDVINVNIRAPYVLAGRVADRLIKAKKPGRIVNIASIAAFSTSGRGDSLYSTSKAAVARMTEALAVEWSRFHINVNAIAPGAFASEMMDGMMARVGDISKGMPRQRIGYPPQLDTTLLYLVSPASEAVTGTVIKVDDGQGNR